MSRSSIDPARLCPLAVIARFTAPSVCRLGGARWVEKGVGPVRLSSLSESVSHGLNGGKGNDVTRKQSPLASICQRGLLRALGPVCQFFLPSSFPILVDQLFVSACGKNERYDTEPSLHTITV